MVLNLKSVFKVKNDTLRKLLDSYVGLKFIGRNQNNNNKLYYLNDLALQEGWYYKPRKNPKTGDIEETLKIISSSEIDTIIADTIMLELIKSDDSFTRFSIPSKKPPTPPAFEWVFIIHPNEADKKAIT